MGAGPSAQAQAQDPYAQALQQYISYSQQQAGAGPSDVDQMIMDQLKRQMTTAPAGTQQAMSIFSRYADPTQVTNNEFTRGADQAAAASAAQWQNRQEGLAMRGLTPQSGAYQAAQNQNMMQRQQAVQRARLDAAKAGRETSLQAGAQMAAQGRAEANRQAAVAGQMQNQANIQQANQQQAQNQAQNALLMYGQYQTAQASKPPTEIAGGAAPMANESYYRTKYPTMSPNDAQRYEQYAANKAQQNAAIAAETAKYGSAADPKKK